MQTLRPLVALLILQFGWINTAPAFELNEILDAPYVSELAGASQSERIAWVNYEKGVRNIWTATAPDFQPVQRTDYTEDDGQRVTGLVLTSDGRYLLFAKGNAEGANPTSDPTHPEIKINLIDLESGAITEMAAGNGAQISPDDSRFTYSKQGQLYLMDFPAPNSVPVEEDAGTPAPLFKSRGSIDSHAWSPDGQRIVFTSNREDHSFIGVYDIQNTTITWIAPGVDFDSHPAWSPDGSQIAFFRTPGLMKDGLRSLVESRRVSLWVAHADGSSAREIWAPDTDNGFFAQFYPDQSLSWSANNRIVFYSEHEGWVHIYAIDPDGDNLADLTPGACEAEQSTLSRDGRTLFFSSNCQAGSDLDIDLRHLWKNDTRGGKPVNLTRGAAIETHPVQIGASDTLAFRIAGTRYPTGVSVIDTSGRNQGKVFPESLPDNYPSREMVEPRQVIFEASDGVKVHGQLFLPENAKAGDERPALIFMHGGPIRQMLLGYHYRGEYYAFAYAVNQFMANQGYVVLSVNYRAGIGYGRDFRMAENQGPRGSSEYRDILAAGKFLQEHPSVNGSKIGLWGGSYGGLLTAMGLARDSDLFAAGVDIHGVHDWSWRGRDFGNGGYWGIDESLYPLAHKSSPVADLSYWSSPVLFIHGDDDRNVMFGQTVDLVQRLRALGVHNEVLVFPDEVHSFLLYRSWMRAYQATHDFFDRFLMSQ